MKSKLTPCRKPLHLITYLTNEDVYKKMLKEYFLDNCVEFNNPRYLATFEREPNIKHLYASNSK